MVKRYRGCRDSAGGAHVYVGHREGWSAAQEYRLRHHVRHSPDGFEWGYAGSGPTELARSMLIDHYYGDTATPPRHGTGEVLFVNPSVYQRFKDRFLTQLVPDRPWVIDSRDIDRWLQAHGLPTAEQVQQPDDQHEGVRHG